LLNLIFFNNAEALDIDEELAIRICLCSAGVWWGIFSLIPLKHLRNVIPNIKKTNLSPIIIGIKSLIKTIKEAKSYPKTLRFLFAYMLYNDGVQSVIVLAAVFGSAELGLSMDVLIICILLVQFVAVIGTILFNYIAKKTGDLNTLKSLIII